MLELDWSTEGAQEFPFGVVVVDPDRMIAALNESSIFYVGAPLGGEIVAFWTR